MLISNDKNLTEAMHKIHTHQLTINEASAQYGLSKRVIYNALRHQQRDINKQKRSLLATQKRLQENLHNIDMELASFI